MCRAVSVFCPTVVVTAWPLAAPPAQLASWVLNARSERRGQSQKPEEIYQLIEKLVPNGKLVVVFVWVAGWGEIGGAAPAVPAFCRTAAVHAPAMSCALHLPCHPPQAGTWRSLGARTICATSGSPSATRWVHRRLSEQEGLVDRSGTAGRQRVCWSPKLVDGQDRLAACTQFSTYWLRRPCTSPPPPAVAAPSGAAGHGAGAAERGPAGAGGRPAHPQCSVWPCRLAPRLLQRAAFYTDMVLEHSHITVKCNVRSRRCLARRRRLSTAARSACSSRGELQLAISSWEGNFRLQRAAAAALSSQATADPPACAGRGPLHQLSAAGSFIASLLNMTAAGAVPETAAQVGRAPAAAALRRVAVPRNYMAFIPCHDVLGFQPRAAEHARPTSRRCRRCRHRLLRPPPLTAALLRLHVQAVLVPSEQLPEDAVTIRGFDFNQVCC